MYKEILSLILSGEIDQLRNIYGEKKLKRILIAYDEGTLETLTKSWIYQWRPQRRGKPPKKKTTITRAELP